MKLKSFVLVFLLAFIFSCSNTNNVPYPLHEKKVLILGNSITQDGRYVDFIEYYLRKNHQEKKLDIISVGLSSETVSGNSEPDHAFPRPNVHTRLDRILDAVKPELVLACYGMNDGIFSANNANRFNAYKRGINALKTKVEAQGATLILLTPTVFDPDAKKGHVNNSKEVVGYKKPYYKYNDVLRDYSDWLLEFKDIQVIDQHKYLNNKLVALKKQHADSTFIPDGVHPDQIGHFYMAKKILKDLYPKIVVGDPVLEIEKLKSDTLFLLSSKRRAVRSEGWLKYIGYKRGAVVKSNNISATQEQVKKLDSKIDKILQKVE
ncbi:SGNH/GDSL hydrolase family protein [Flavivirga algicola]|uniref:SGNH/GDSL hydrolase family protein n=1 Tax=Flavivirga algicola TaxID=2729136 RepID=A0ABX1S1E5_9FLAO|nr:SGNH/GDSL hydrolase family protein [Flavivirga algicola]NMH89657.1 SGNH/GDSL hydrolase family protein [Flavivirga algicola]